MKKQIFTKVTGLVIKEAFMFLAMRVVCLINSMVETFANQLAGTSEIERLKGETSLVFFQFMFIVQTMIVLDITINLVNSIGLV